MKRSFLHPHQLPAEARWDFILHAKLLGKICQQKESPQCKRPCPDSTFYSKLYNFTTCARLEISLLGLPSQGGPDMKMNISEARRGAVARGKYNLTDETFI